MTITSKNIASPHLEVVKPIPKELQVIFSKPALEFLVKIIHTFTPKIDELLENRIQVQENIDQGALPTFPSETTHIRKDDWKANPLPKDLQDRRVEITGPVDRKMIINALNSGANVFMADFEDSCSPTWENIIQGQLNLYDAVRRTIEYTNPDGRKHYSLKDDPAVLMVRPRGLHLKEEGILYQGQPVYGSLVDFGLYFFHNAVELINQGTGPYFYLPKLQHYREARLWNDIFNFAQDYLDIQRGTIKATVLLEHILSAFQMDEIIYELREHSAGLNSGRWDYIFSFIKTFWQHPEFVLPDRDQVTMNSHFLKSYVDLLVLTCHKRGVSGMGGMAAQIPIKDDSEANDRALRKVRQDKLREVKAGHDGTWVAHPGLIQIAKEVFDEHMSGQNQIDYFPEMEITTQDLLRVPEGTITEDGVRTNISVGIRYLAAWLSGNGCVPIYNLMEDAATAEISRSQLWQWIHHEAELASGKILTRELFTQFHEEEMAKIQKEIGEEAYDSYNFDLAAKVFKNLVLRERIPEFLTLEAYQHLA